MEGFIQRQLKPYHFYTSSPFLKHRHMSAHVHTHTHNLKDKSLRLIQKILLRVLFKLWRTVGLIQLKCSRGHLRMTAVRYGMTK